MNMEPFVCVLKGAWTAGRGSDFETGGPWEVALGFFQLTPSRAHLDRGKLSGGQLEWGPAPRKKIFCPQTPQGPLQFSSVQFMVPPN